MVEYVRTLANTENEDAITKEVQRISDAARKKAESEAKAKKWKDPRIVGWSATEILYRFLPDELKNRFRRGETAVVQGSTGTYDLKVNDRGEAVCTCPSFTGPKGDWRRAKLKQFLGMTKKDEMPTILRACKHWQSISSKPPVSWK